MMKKLDGFLQANLDVFAWNHFDTCRIFHVITSHALNIDPRHVLVKQKRRGKNLERSATLNEELDRLKGNERKATGK